MIIGQVTTSQRIPVATAKAERETIITFTEADEVAEVYTFRKSLWPVCERAGGRLIRSGRRENVEESREYSVPLAELYRVLNRIGSELRDESERRKKAVERAAEEAGS